jgi:8-oxo-dGTP pyrophosphatase MutT (NUDIX family)
MLHPDDPRAALRAALDPDPELETGSGDRLAAILAPLIEAPEPALLFTVRASGLSRHAGEISFPGGLQDPGESLEQTALRESFEEIGLTGAEVLGALPSVHTFVSGILMVPFVGILDEPPVLAVSAGEIAEVLTFSLLRLADAEATVEHEREGGRTWRGWAYELDGHTVWGATGFVLHTLLDVVRKETSWLSKAQ